MQHDCLERVLDYDNETMRLGAVMLLVGASTAGRAIGGAEIKQAVKLCCKKPSLSTDACDLPKLSGIAD